MDTKEINSIILGCYKGVEFGWWYVNKMLWKMEAIGSIIGCRYESFSGANYLEATFLDFCRKNWYYIETIKFLWKTKSWGFWMLYLNIELLMLTNH